MIFPDFKKHLAKGKNKVYNIGIRKKRAQMKRKIIYLTVAIALRLFHKYKSPLIPEINGGYYPLQIRILIESGHWGFQTGH